YPKAPAGFECRVSRLLNHRHGKRLPTARITDAPHDQWASQSSGALQILDLVEGQPVCGKDVGIQVVSQMGKCQSGEAMAMEGNAAGVVIDIKPQVVGNAVSPGGLFADFAFGGFDQSLARLKVASWLVEQGGG